MTTVSLNPATPAQPTTMRPIGLVGPMLALAKRELVRFLRQRGRVVGAVATPVLLWVMLGFGLNRAVVMPPPEVSPEAGAAGESLGYLAYFYPGMITMVVLFTAIFSTISVIEDRKEGFLQAVLVSPSSRLAIVLGKVLGGAAVATAQGIVLLAAWPLVGPWPGPGLPGVAAMVGAAGCIFVIAAGLTALGLCFAWWMESSGAFHGVMSLIMMPMWLLSGAMFPLATAGGLRYVMYANPLTYGHATFLALLLGENQAGGVPLIVAGPMMVALAAAVVVAALWIANRQESGVRTR